MNLPLKKAIRIYQEEGLISLISSTGSFVSSKLEMINSFVRTRYRYVQYRRKYGEAVAHPDKTIWIKPERVQLTLSGIAVPDSACPANWDRIKHSYYILSGDWDTYSTDLEQSKHYRGLIEYFDEDLDWTETTEWEVYQQQGRDAESIRNHCQEQEELYQKIKKEGYDEGHPITVHIDRDGRLVHQDGFHRITIARLLNIEQIPARVAVRHKQWQKARSRKGTDDYGSANSQYQNHPDLQDCL